MRCGAGRYGIAGAAMNGSPRIGDVIDERPRQAVDERVVTELADCGAEVDRVDLAATDREVVGVDDDPHRDRSDGERGAPTG